MNVAMHHAENSRLKVKHFPKSQLSHEFANLTVNADGAELVLYFDSLYEIIEWSEKITHIAQEKVEELAAAEAQEELPLGAAFHTEG
jgi:hypothetical protein